jgi:hypothetical protein
MQYPLLPVLLLGQAAVATQQAQDSHENAKDIIPDNSGDCNALCDITPTCQSTLFDTVSRHCYSFDCVVGDRQIPYQFIGYRKPGSSDLCPAEYEIPAPGGPPPSNAAAPPPAPSPTPCDCDSESENPVTSVKTVQKPIGGTPTTGTEASEQAKTPAPVTTSTIPNGNNEGSGGSSSPGSGTSDGSGNALPGAPNASGGITLTRRRPATAELLLAVSLGLFFL